MTLSISRFWIATVGAGRTRGKIGMATCPGWAPRGYTSAGAVKDFEQDMGAIVRWAPSLVLTLLDHDELWEYRLGLLPQTLAEHSIPWQQFPISPTGIPDEAFEVRWRQASPALHDMLRAGSKLLVHCSDGMLRSGLLAGLLLVELGCRPEDAINRVRAARPDALTIPEQRSFLLRQEIARRAEPARFAGTGQPGQSALGTEPTSAAAHLVTGLARLKQADTAETEHREPSPPVELAKYRQSR